MQDDTIKSSVIYADLRGDLQTVERRGEIMREGKLRLLEPEPVVVTEHLTKRFQSVTALDDISLSIPEGRIIGMVGPNGSGKSTFLKILAGLYAEYGGEVRICGHKPGAATKAVTAYLPDKPGIPYDFTPEDAIKIYEGFFRDFDTEQCREMLKLFDIKETAPVKEMSKGVVDKLQICLLMARKARLYLLDEPIGGVDIAARDHVLDIILEEFNPGATMIIVTHLISEIERLFDSVIVLKNGKVEAFRDSDSIRMQYGTLEEGLKEMFAGREI